jgi:hypothetical protein
VSVPNPVPEIRVTRLVYRLVSESTTDDFGHAEPLDGHLDRWTFRLEGGLLDAIPSVEFRSREAAIEDIEPRLREWAQGTFLAPGAVRIRFDYERSDVEVVDPQPSNVFVFPEPARLTLSMGTPTIVIGHRFYPAPDPTFRSTPLTDLLTERLRAHQEGRA